MSRAKSGTTAALIAVLSLEACFLIFAGPLHYSKSRWDGEPNKRRRMLGSYVKQHGLLGRDLSHVQSDLGPPDNSAYTHEDFHSWFVGVENWLFPIDNDFLVVETDGNRVIGWTVVDDDSVRDDAELRSRMRRN